VLFAVVDDVAGLVVVFRLLPLSLNFPLSLKGILTAFLLPGSLDYILRLLS